MFPVYTSEVKRSVELFRALHLEKSKQEPLLLAGAVEDNVRRIQSILYKLSEGQRKASILQPYIKAVEQQLAQLQSLSHGLKEPFMLFVVGMGKFGKSTLVNALLGGNFADIDILPKTWKIDIFRAGTEQDLVSIRFHDGTERSMTQNEAKELLRREEAKREESEDLIAEKFQEHSVKLSAIEEKEELLEMLHKELLYQSTVAEVVHRCPANSLLEDFLVVDTPGLWQEGILESSKEDIRSYYHKADGVLWLLDATKLATEKPQLLLEDLEQSFAAIGGRSDNIIGVVNRIDLVRNQGEDVVARVMEQANAIFGSWFLDIVPISSQEALQGVLAGDDELIRTSGLNGLLERIDTHFLAGASSLKYESKKVGLERILVDSDQMMKEYEHRLLPDLERYGNLAAEVTERLNAFRSSTVQNIDRLLDEHYREIENNISLYSARLFDFQEHDHHARDRFVRETIFEGDKLENRVRREIENIRREFSLLGRSILNDVCFVEYKYLAKSPEPSIAAVAVPSSFSLAAQSFAIDNEMLIGGVGAFIAGGAILGPLGMLAAVLLGATGLLKSIVVSFKKKEVERVLLLHLGTSVDKVRRTIVRDLEDMIRRLKEEASEVAFKTFEELHGPPDEANAVINLTCLFSELQKQEITEVDLAYLLGVGGERSA